MPIYELGDRRAALPQPDGDGLNYWIAPNAFILGDVTLKKNSSVWFGAVLRGDNEPIVIGEDSNVQENTVMHTDPGAPLTVGARVTVGHMVMLHGCEIGDGSLIGIGAVILNHAKIGKNCLIGAGAIITEGKVIPDNSLVMGAPGKIVREVSPEQVAKMQEGIDKYVARWRRFAKDLKRDPRDRG
jgi:carbonic anhydrase/acetyltransferase-like protein (isoleucine patch superfamily)